MKMKTKLIGLALFGLTAATVAFYPALNSNGATIAQPIAHPTLPVVLPGTQQPKVEVVFVLDTTGSMGGLIAAAKEKIWSIATTMASAQQVPHIKMGLVAYRDRGDAYITKIVDLSSDLDSMYGTLVDFVAAGGGDGPESVNQALYDSIHHISWTQDPDAYKVVFLVGDAPPHMDYLDDIKYPQTLAAARDKGIVVNTIQCGELAATRHQWQQIAQLSQGHYFQVEQTGSAVAIATPYDADIARLSAKLDQTRLYYGNREEKEKAQRKIDATDKLHAFASIESRARRAAFNMSASGKANLVGEHDLVEDVASGRIDLADVEAEELPEPMQAMAPEEQSMLIAETAKKRDNLQRQLKDLGAQRARYLDDKVKEAGGAKASLDHKIYDAVREQAEKKGIKYEDGPEY
jgi:Mg-chelatase subunit ChlD